MLALLMNRYVIGGAAFLVFVIGLFGTGYYKGSHATKMKYELQLAQAKAEAEKITRESEQLMAQAKDEIGKKYANEIAALNRRAVAAESDAGRLRLKISRDCVSKNSRTPARTNDTSRTEQGDGTVTIDFSGIEKRTFELGRYCDELAVKLQAWQEYGRIVSERK